MADTNFQERMNALENRSHLRELNFNLEKLREEYESIKSKKLSALINRNFFRCYNGGIYLFKEREKFFKSCIY